MKPKTRKNPRPVPRDSKAEGKEQPKHGVPAMMNNVLKVTEKALPKDDEKK